jgi:hypothetical protein
MLHERHIVIVIVEGFQGGLLHCFNGKVVEVGLARQGRCSGDNKNPF